MNENVFDLAQADTSLKKVSHKEYAGPCPGCGGSDRFHVQPDRKDGGAWMCRNCWPAESKGWADGIEYLRQFRNMSFQAARAYLEGEIDTALERVYKVASIQPEYGSVPKQVMQERYQRYVTAAIERISKPEGQAGLDYLLSRGLREDTIEKARIGYAVYNGKPCIVIPWYDEKEQAYWRVNMRDIRPGIPENERYTNLPGCSNAGLYLSDILLKRKLPTFLVEGEIDALSLAQAAGDIVNVVATGSTEGSRTPKWEGRLARQPAILIAFDREEKGDKAAQYWLKIFEGVTPALRYRPLAHDVNEMLTQGYDVRMWVQSALAYLSEDQDSSSQPERETPVTFPAQVLALKCSVCGIDFSEIDTGSYDENETAFCDYDDNMVAYCSRGSGQQQQAYEQFLNICEQLASVLPGCTVTPIPSGYTLAEHVKAIEQRAAENYKRTLQYGHTKAG